jgi:hypothetical protein
LRGSRSPWQRKFWGVSPFSTGGRTTGSSRHLFLTLDRQELAPPSQISSDSRGARARYQSSCPRFCACLWLRCHRQQGSHRDQPAHGCCAGASSSGRSGERGRNYTQPGIAIVGRRLAGAHFNTCPPSAAKPSGARLRPPSREPCGAAHREELASVQSGSAGRRSQRLPPAHR